MPKPPTDAPSQAELELAARALGSPYSFIGRWAWTFDEAEAGKPDGQVIRQFPRKPHIRAYIHAWLNTNLLIVPKSRRMLATWTFCALDYWLAMSRGNVRQFIASTKKTKSDKLLARCLFIHEHLPEMPHFPRPRVERKNGQEGDPTRLDFPELGSSIQSVSEEPDELRQEGATGIHCEEFQSWKWQERAWTALRPVVQGGGKLVVVGTPMAGTFFRDLVFDQTSVQREAESMQVVPSVLPQMGETRAAEDAPVTRARYEQILGMTYVEARAYLHSVGKWGQVEGWDGYSIIALAAQERNIQNGPSPR